MATQPTNLPVPSESPRDLKFNAGKIDEFVTSLTLKYVDRLGGEHYTIEGMKQLVLQQIYNLGWNLKGSFQEGGEVSAAGDLLQDTSTGIWYRWDDLSSLPKTVPPGSTPESAGGTGNRKWQPVDVSDVLRKDLANPTGSGLVGFSDSLTYPTGTIGNYILQLKNEIARRSIPQLERYMAYMAAGKIIKIACYGDSTTDGNGTTGWVINETNSDGTAAGKNHNSTSPNTWPVRLQTLLNDMYGTGNIKVFNAGYSGKRMDNGWAYDNYDAAIPNSEFGRCDIVIIDFGLNDTAESGSQVDNHVTQTLKLLLKIIDSGSLPVLLTSGPDYRVDTDGGDGWDNKEVSRQINQAKTSIGSELHVPVIDKASLMKDWLEKNNDGYAWGTVQSDGLHFGDIGHFYQAGVVAKHIFGDIINVPQNGRETIGYMDSRAGSLAGRNWTTSITGTRFGKNPLYPDSFISANPGAQLLEMWVWCEGVDTSCIYRCVDNDGQASASNTAIINVQGSAVSGLQLYNAAPPNSGFGYAALRYTDMPMALCRFQMGLNKVTYSGPTASLGNSLFHGYFEFVDGWKQGGKVLNTPSYPRNNLLDSTGKIYHYQSASSLTAPTVFSAIEDAKGSNVLGLSPMNGTTILTMELSIGKGYGLVLMGAKGFQGSTKYSEAGLILYRDATGIISIRNYGKDAVTSAVTISSALASSSSAYAFSMKELRIDFTRTSTGLVITVYPDWNRTGASIMSLSIASSASMPIPRAGIFGSILMNNADMSNEGGLTVNSAQVAMLV